jgi:hypothetical protein
MLGPMKSLALAALVVTLAGCADNPPPTGEEFAYQRTLATGGYTTDYYYPDQQRKAAGTGGISDVCCCVVPVALVIGIFVLMVIWHLKNPQAYRRHRASHCYRCKTPVDSQWHAMCPACGWISCPQCGACGCGYVRY